MTSAVALPEQVSDDITRKIGPLDFNQRLKGKGKGRGGGQQFDQV